MPASASPSVTLVTTPPTLVSSLTGLTVTPALLKTSLAYLPHGTDGAQRTTLTLGLARFETDVMCIGLPLATIISSSFLAKVLGWPTASLALVTVSMLDVSAEANTSAFAPWVMELARDELPL